MVRQADDDDIPCETGIVLITIKVRAGFRNDERIAQPHGGLSEGSRLRYPYLLLSAQGNRQLQHVQSWTAGCKHLIFYCHPQIA